jgi:hypothetical protein
MVKKSQLLERGLIAATREAESRGFSKEDWRAEDIVRQSRQIVKDLFFAIQFDNTTPEERANFTSVETWEHRARTKRESDRINMRFDRGSFQTAAQNYIEQSWMQDDQLDWFIVDALTYAELIATLDFAIANTGSLSAYLGKHRGPILVRLAPLILRLGRWISAVLVLGFAFLIHWALFTTLLMAGCIIWLVTYFRRRKRRQLLDTMEDCYGVLADEKPSWRLIWEEFARSRAAGVVWDTVAYKVVESRLPTLSPSV